jgi:hypothetical protein
VPVVIVVAGVANVEVSLPVDGFPLAYAPVCYPQGRTRVRVAGVGLDLGHQLIRPSRATRASDYVAGC